MRKTWMLIMTCLFLAVFSAPAFASWVEFGPGLGTFPITLQETTMPQTAIVDNSGDVYPITLNLKGQQGSPTISGKLITPGVTLWGTEVRLIGIQNLPLNTANTGSQNISHLGILLRRSINEKWSLGIAYGYTMANLRLQVADPVAAARGGDPGIELDGTVIPVGARVMGNVTAEAQEVSITVNRLLMEDVMLSLSLRQIFNSQSSAWEYTVVTTSGSEYKPDFSQLPPVNLNGTALELSLVVAF